MSSVKTTVRYSTGLFALAILFSVAVAGFGQSRDINNPTTIVTFPVSGTLGSGTYYYQIPAALVANGRANAVLDLTPPDGGASMTVTLSGRRCCPPEAYIGVTTGLADRLRESTTFDIPGSEDLLVTVYISVGAKQTVGYRINFNIGATSSGIIVTPPTPTPTPTPRPALTPATPTYPDGSVCTDLGVSYYRVAGPTATKIITGTVRNHTTTHPYKGYRRLQWLEVFDITDSEKGPPLVTRILIPPIIDPGATFSYEARHILTVNRRTRYKIQIVYSPYNARDRSPYNDDCNSANNTTRREVVGEDFLLDTLPIP